MHKLKNVLLHLLSLILFICFVLLIRPVQQTFEFDYDEGLNLIKALLYSEGFSLYTQIWSDQPPLLTVLLSYWFNIFGRSVFAARLLVLIFSALLLWSFYQIIRNSLGKIPAFVSTLLLFTSWLFVRLSISVMVGLPALSLAMLSIYNLTLYKQFNYNYFIFLSGGLLALSLQTKLFTAFLIPLAIFYLIDFNITNKTNKLTLHVRPVFSWIFSLSITYIFISIIFNSFNYEQLINAHLQIQEKENLPNFYNIKELKYLLSQDYDYVFLALIGSIAILFKRQKEGLLPLTWLITTILLLLNHQPIWYHHYTLLAIPIAWLSAYAIALVIDYFPQGWQSSFKPLKLRKIILPCLATTILLTSMIAIPAKPLGKPPKDPKLIEQINKYKKSTQWIFTDRPIYAFVTNLKVPPEIAVMSAKRLNTGNLTTQDILTVLQTYHPEQIVLDRWTTKIKSDRQINTYINQNYTKTYQNQTTEHYLLKRAGEALSGAGGQGENEKSLPRETTPSKPPNKNFSLSLLSAPWSASAVRSL